MAKKLKTKKIKLKHLSRATLEGRASKIAQLIRQPFFDRGEV